MRISDDTRFPHPVLSNQTGDYTSGDFSVAFEATEVPRSSALQLAYSITLTEPGIRDLVMGGQATIGCFVRCNDTYFTALRTLSWPQGRSDFQPGALLNRVTLQPLIWLNSAISRWDPESLHDEFDPPVSLNRGDVLAIAPEHIMSVGQAKFAAIESIFEMHRTPELPAGTMQIDASTDRIGILVPPATYDAISLLRGQATGHPVVMNGVYLPAVMEVLNLLSAEHEAYDGYRWYQPFMAKCDTKGVVVGPGCSILESAQKLLDAPLRALSVVSPEGEA